MNSLTVHLGGKNACFLSVFLSSQLDETIDELSQETVGFVWVVGMSLNFFQDIIRIFISSSVLPFPCLPKGSSNVVQTNFSQSRGKMS